jgi:ferric-chelate reductase (NADPH)
MENALVLPKRIRNELCFRTIQVSSKQMVGQNFWRVTFEHLDLAGFHSAVFDDHIKVFFPTNKARNIVKPSVTEEGIVWADGQQPLNRDYTPLDFDGKSRLVLDFFRHDGGVASGWAETAEEGQMLVMGGPRGSLVVPTNYASQIYICDETGLPALRRRLAQIAKQNIALFIFAEPQVVAEYLPDLNE